MQRIENVVWYPYRIPLRSRFTTAHGSLTAREGAIVEVITEDGLSGVGEIAPLPEFAGDNLETALAPLPTLSGQLKSKTPADALALLYAGSPELPATTVCGLESALFDIIGRLTDRSVSAIVSSTDNRNVNSNVLKTLNTVETQFIASCDSSLFFSSKRGIPVNAVIGALPLAATIARAQELATAGFQCIKLKVGSNPDQEVARVAAIRAAIGPSIHLRLDANAAWTLDQAVTILARCAAYDLQFAHAAADILILKPQLVGGLRAGQQMICEAAAYGVQCVVTSTIETGVGVAGAAHLAAAMPEIKLECGLATLPLLEDDLLLEGLSIQNGVLAVPAGPGLGIFLDRAALARYSVDKTHLI